MTEDIIVAQQAPLTGDEKPASEGSLGRHRDVVLWKLEGLYDADLRPAMPPSGNTLLGLVKLRAPPGMRGTSTSCASSSTGRLASITGPRARADQLASLAHRQLVGHA